MDLHHLDQIIGYQLFILTLHWIHLHQSYKVTKETIVAP